MDQEQKRYEIKDSSIEGKGVFIKVDLQPNEVIGVAVVFQKDNNFVLSDLDKKGTTEINGVQRRFKITGDFGRYVNHAWFPNDNAELQHKGNKVYVVATKRIPLGAEILVDYDNNPHYLKPSSPDYK
jgi:SET domain